MHLQTTTFSTVRFLRSTNPKKHFLVQSARSFLSYATAIQRISIPISITSLGRSLRLFVLSAIPTTIQPNTYSRARRLLRLFLSSTSGRNLVKLRPSSLPFPPSLISFLLTLLPLLLLLNPRLLLTFPLALLSLLFSRHFLFHLHRRNDILWLEKSLGDGSRARDFPPAARDHLRTWSRPARACARAASTGRRLRLSYANFYAKFYAKFYVNFNQILS